MINLQYENWVGYINRKVENKNSIKYFYFIRFPGTQNSLFITLFLFLHQPNFLRNNFESLFLVVRQNFDIEQKAVYVYTNEGNALSEALLECFDVLIEGRMPCLHTSNLEHWWHFISRQLIKAVYQRDDLFYNVYVFFIICSLFHSFYNCK